MDLLEQIREIDDQLMITELTEEEHARLLKEKERLEKLNSADDGYKI